MVKEKIVLIVALVCFIVGLIALKKDLLLNFISNTNQSISSLVNQPLSFSASLNQSLAPNTLYLSNPIKSFNGIIEKIQGNIITVYQTSNNDDSISYNPLLPPGKRLIYEVVVTDKTQFDQTEFVIPLLFTISTKFLSKTDIKNVPIGSTVTCETNDDLRTLKQPQFQATKIHRWYGSNILGGSVIKIDNNKISVTAHLVADNPIAFIPYGKDKDYTIYLTPNTEISGLITNPKGESEPKRFTTSQLGPGTKINIYFDSDITITNKLQAARVEVL